MAPGHSALSLAHPHPRRVRKVSLHLWLRKGGRRAEAGGSKTPRRRGWSARVWNVYVSLLELNITRLLCWGISRARRWEISRKEYRSLILHTVYAREKPLDREYGTHILNARTRRCATRQQTQEHEKMEHFVCRISIVYVYGVVLIDAWNLVQI